MIARIRRRDALALIGGAAAWPVAARAQQMRKVTILLTRPEDDPPTQAAFVMFQQRLAELGWREGVNIRIERRSAGVDPRRIDAVVAEVVGIRPDVILAQNTPVVASLRKQTTSIPIVFVQVSDPVGDGFVESLARPGANATGFTNTMASLGSKWLELLREAAPKVSQVGFLFNRAVSPGGGTFYFGPFQEAAAAFGIKPVLLELPTPDAIDDAVAAFAAAGGNGTVADSDSFLAVHRDRIIAALNRHRLPGTFASPVYARAGALLSYGIDSQEQWAPAAGYVDRILRGENPANLAVQQPTKFEFVINRKAAKALGLTFPPSFELRATEVIE